MKKWFIFIWSIVVLFDTVAHSENCNGHLTLGDPITVRHCIIDSVIQTLLEPYLGKPHRPIWSTHYIFFPMLFTILIYKSPTLCVLLHSAY